MRKRSSLIIVLPRRRNKSVSAIPFLDANIFIRHLMVDEPNHSPRATAFLERIERGEITARTSDTVIFEIVYVLQRVYRVPRVEIRDALLPLIELPGLVLPNKRRFRQVFDYYTQHSLSFADAYHATLVTSLGLAGLMSFDRGLDRLPGLVRLEP